MSCDFYMETPISETAFINLEYAIFYTFPAKRKRWSHFVISIMASRAEKMHFENISTLK